MRALEWRPGRVGNYRLRFNLEGRPKGKAAPANIEPSPGDEVWGVLYKITRRDLIWLDSTEGVPGPRYRQLWIEAEDREGNRMPCVTYIAEGKETDGNPSLRYITLLREGARASSAARLTMIILSLVFLLENVWIAPCLLYTSDAADD